MSTTSKVLDLIVKFDCGICEINALKNHTPEMLINALRNNGKIINNITKNEQSLKEYAEFSLWFQDKPLLTKITLEEQGIKNGSTLEAKNTQVKSTLIYRIPKTNEVD